MVLPILTVMVTHGVALTCVISFLQHRVLKLWSWRSAVPNDGHRDEHSHLRGVRVYTVPEIPGVVR
jgi:hypothetical protein